MDNMRIFYLATSVKIQFFKTFILPYKKFPTRCQRGDGLVTSGYLFLRLVLYNFRFIGHHIDDEEQEIDDDIKPLAVDCSRTFSHFFTAFYNPKKRIFLSSLKLLRFNLCPKN
ncbi:hypothetical protein BpHYR1_049897 [Brachionus plicatilis]|uniref:Uncharacterized protein n=1 Tax=Brachionus plicatilis TaxID=10195 RepID=A0A3M7QEY7_BRAPC|nr:hypothetical protein BpHYR1_049897 [Brachionus plicatilis]